jgi:hypothetical protein
MRNPMHCRGQLKHCPCATADCAVLLRLSCHHICRGLFSSAGIWWWCQPGLQPGTGPGTCSQCAGVPARHTQACQVRQLARKAAEKTSHTCDVTLCEKVLLWPGMVPLLQAYSSSCCVVIAGGGACACACQAWRGADCRWSPPYLLTLPACLPACCITRQPCSCHNNSEHPHPCACSHPNHCDYPHTAAAGPHQPHHRHLHCNCHQPGTSGSRQRLRQCTWTVAGT